MISMLLVLIELRKTIGVMVAMMVVCLYMRALQRSRNEVFIKVDGAYWYVC